SVWAIHAFVPHEHFTKGPDGRVSIELGKHWLFILAITLHNFPEGMSVGVAFGDEIESGAAVMLGIGLQNLPEGLAVAAALVGDGSTQARAFVIALLTGLVEPVGGLVGALAVSLSTELLPWGLAFAGGAMLFVISGEVIPETHREGVEQIATFSLVLGFVVMMMLDVTFAGRRLGWVGVATRARCAGASHHRSTPGAMMSNTPNRRITAPLSSFSQRPAFS